MKTLRFLPLLALLVALPACPSNPVCPGGVGSAAPPQSVSLVGEPVELRLSAPVQFGCHQEGEPPPTPTTVSVEVHGPDNQLVPSQVTFQPSSSTALLRFTPEKPGRHHVFAAFDPVGGIQQFDVQVARDRSAELPLETLPLPCESLERTRHGTWVCDGTVLREGVVEQQFPGSWLAVADDVVWVVDGTQLRRFVDTGTALELTGTLSHNQGPPEFLLAAADELVVLYLSTLQRVTFNGTALTSAGLTPWVSPPTSPTFPAGPRGLLVRKGDLLAVIYRTTANFNRANEACPHQLVGERFQRTTAPCVAFVGDVVGFEPGALWLADMAFTPVISNVSLVDWTGTAMVTRASLSLDFTFQPSEHPLRRQSVVPVLRSNRAFASDERAVVPVYSPEHRTLLFEHLDSEASDPRASSTLLWGSPANGGMGAPIRVRPRSTSP